MIGKRSPTAGPRGLFLGLALVTGLLGAPPLGAQDASTRDGRPSPAGEPGVQPTRPAVELEVYGTADYDWRIRPLGGEPTILGSFRGRVLFINLWASWCRPCVREMASIERLRERISDTGITFLIVAAEGEGPVRRFLRRYPYDLPVYLEEQRIPPAFGLIGLPTTWVVDREGRIVLLRHGEAVWDTDEVEAFLRSLDRAR